MVLGRGGGRRGRRGRKRASDFTLSFVTLLQGLNHSFHSPSTCLADCTLSCSPTGSWRAAASASQTVQQAQQLLLQQWQGQQQELPLEQPRQSMTMPSSPWRPSLSSTMCWSMPARWRGLSKQESLNFFLSGSREPGHALTVGLSHCSSSAREVWPWRQPSPVLMQ